MSKDTLYIFEMLSSYFQTRQFQSIPTDTDSVSMYATFQKHNLYLINLISLQDEKAYNHEMYVHYRNTTKAQFKGVESDKVYLLNILIVDQPKEIFNQVDVEPESNSDFIDVHWVVDSHEHELVIPGKQLQSVLGLEEPVKELVTNGLEEFYNMTHRHNHAYVSLLFIILNVAMWLALEYNGGSHNTETLLQFGAINVDIIQNTGSYWRFFASMFIHISFGHLVYNVFSLYAFGSRLERLINSFQFIFIYVFSGVCGGLAGFIGNLVLGTDQITAGANGGVYGLLAAVLLLMKTEGKEIKGINAIVMWLIFIVGIMLSVISPNVDAFAHIGGFLGGIIATIPIIIYNNRQQGGYFDEER